MAIQAGDILWTVDADVKKFEAALGRASKRAKGIGEKFAKHSKAIGVGFTAAGGAITAAMGGAVMKSQEFSEAMAEVNTLGVSDLEGLSDAVKDVSREFGQELTVSANAAYQAISAGAKEAEVPKLLEEAARAATAGVTDLATAVELGTSVTNAFGMEIGQAGQVFDQAFIAVKGGVTTFEELSASLGKLSPIMAAANVETGEMFASVAALTKGGIATAEAVTGMKAVMTGIIKPTSEAAKLAEELGLKFDVTALKSEGLVGFLNNVKQATGGNVETMAQLFGSTEALNAVLALTGEQAGNFASLAQQMSNAQGATNEAFNAFVEANPGFAFQQLKQQIAVLAVEVGDKLAPTLLAIVKRISPVIDAVIEWIQNNPQLTQTLALVTAAIGGLMLVIGPLLVMLPGLATAFSAVSAIVPVVGAVIAALTGPVGLIVAAVAAAAVLIVKNWDFVKQRTMLIFETIGLVIGRAIQFWTNPIMGWINLLNRLINTVNKLTGLRIPNLGFAQGGVVPGFAQGGMIPGFAAGGQVGARIVKVGERGPELAALPVGTRVLSHADMMRAVQQGAGMAGGSPGDGGGVSPVFNITISGETDPNAIVEKIKGPFMQFMVEKYRNVRR